MNLAELRAHGFDKSEHIPFTRKFRVGCSCCQATTVNGTPTHEKGCHKAVHECAGCNELIPLNYKYCGTC